MSTVVAPVEGELSLPEGYGWVQELVKSALPGACVAYQRLYNGEVGTLIAAAPNGVALAVPSQAGLKLTTVAWKRVDALDVLPEGLIVTLKSGKSFELKGATEDEASKLRDFYVSMAGFSIASDNAAASTHGDS